MKEMDTYQLWASKNLEDDDLNQELASIAADEEGIKDRFYRDLEFGTAGLRGVLGAGTNRMNIYTVRKATQGMATYLNKQFDNPSVAISYDSRIKSDLFAKETSRVFVANGISVHLYPELMPVPCLSYAVRTLNCKAGVMVTASHNPAKYNGYKAYGADGCQLGTDAATAVLDEVEKVDIFNGVMLADFDQAVADGKIQYIPQTVAESYLDAVAMQSIHPSVYKNANLKLVYSPLNGAGNKPVRELLNKMGMEDITVVPEQENPDGNFPTCPFPNPEIHEALDLGLALSKKIGADLLMATDPDCDRVGIAVRDENGEYVLLSGNQVGVLMFYYICSQREELGTMPINPLAIKTIVSTKLIDAIAADFDVELLSLLTGFKYIGEQIGLLEAKGEEDRYIFGFEESYGYLVGTHARDKDAVVGSMMICEMASFYKQMGSSVLQQLNWIYKKYGYYLDTQASFELEGASGMEKMQEIMKNLRKNPPIEIGGLQVLYISDYKTSKIYDQKTGEESLITLPKSDVLMFSLEKNAQVIIRPSGTEPKIKAYYSCSADDRKIAEDLDRKLKEDFRSKIGQ